MFAKKSLGLGLVIGLLAMAFAALPAIASAAPQLTQPAGTSVKVGTTVTATSKNAVTVTEAGELKCEKVVVNGKVKTNSGTVVEVEMDGTNDSATNCKLGTTAVSVVPTLEEIKLTSTTKTAKFTFVVAGGLLTEASTSTVTYTSPATSIHVAGPVTGTVPGTFSGDFTVADAAGAITVD